MKHINHKILLLLSIIAIVTVTSCSNMGAGELIQLDEIEAENLNEETDGQFFMYIGSHEEEARDLIPTIEKVSEQTKQDIKYFVYNDITAVGYDDESVDYEASLEKSTPVQNLEEDYIYFLENEKVIDKFNLEDFYIYDQDQLNPRLTEFIERY